MSRDPETTGFVAPERPGGLVVGPAPSPESAPDTQDLPEGDRPFPDATDYGAVAACVVGAILLGVALFLPKLSGDSTIVDNALIEEDGGWLYLIAVAVLVATAGGYLRSGRPSGFGKVVAALLTFNLGRVLLDDGERELYPVDLMGELDMDADPVTADPAAGLYLATAGAALAIVAILVMRARQLPDPDAAEEAHEEDDEEHEPTADDDRADDDRAHRPKS